MIRREYFTYHEYMNQNETKNKKRLIKKEISNEKYFLKKMP